MNLKMDMFNQMLKTFEASKIGSVSSAASSLPDTASQSCSALSLPDTAPKSCATSSLPDTSAPQSLADHASRHIHQPESAKVPPQRVRKENLDRMTPIQMQICRCLKMDLYSNCDSSCDNRNANTTTRRLHTS